MPSYICKFALLAFPVHLNVICEVGLKDWFRYHISNRQLITFASKQANILDNAGKRNAKL